MEVHGAHGLYREKFPTLLQEQSAAAVNIQTSLEAAESILLELEETESDESALITEILAQYRTTLDLARGVAIEREVVHTMQTRLLDGHGLDGDEGGDANAEDFAKWFDDEVQARVKEYEAQTDEEKYHGVPGYVDLLKKIWEVNHTAPFRLNGAEADDDDLEMVSEQMSFKCPITTMLMEDPHTSSACNHSYSSAILDIIRKSGGRIECPVTGCRRYVTLRDLKPNKQLARKIERMRESQEDNRADADDDDMIVQ
ncbi:hypothetical protein HK101_011833 [Irineochytrium annulatum]|nr:hypothetical protein HK101_011833 [Irineochytrium annulatum]